MSGGHIRKRGDHSWELKFDAGRDADGKRKVRYDSFKGTKAEAKLKLAELVLAVGRSAYVDSSKATVAAHVRSRIDQWESAPEGITARTAQRYRNLCKNQIVPHLGARLLQKLTRLDIERWHNALHQSGLAARTIGHAHRVLSKALGDAESDGLVVKNMCHIPQGAQDH